jgi:hypothetical protein
MKDDHCTCTVEVSPDEVDAGADITLKAQVTSSLRHGLRGARISIRNNDGIELAQADLTETDDDAYTSDDIVLAAPCVVGECVYRAVVIAADKDGAWHDQASAEVRFIVTPHAAELNAWDVPHAIVAGARFKFMAGIRCSAGCCLAGRTLRIVAEDGAEIGSANLGQDTWPGTDALYVAEIEGEAPPAPGAYRLEVRIAASETQLPHAAGALAVVLKVVSAPDCEVAVEAFDRENQAPIKGARVVMHPYRAVTDDKGVAKLKVTKGHYDILVSASKYVPVSTNAEVAADMTTRAELDADPTWESPEDEALV